MPQYEYFFTTLVFKVNSECKYSAKPGERIITSMSPPKLDYDRSNWECPVLIERQVNPAPEYSSRLIIGKEIDALDMG